MKWLAAIVLVLCLTVTANAQVPHRAHVRPHAQFQTHHGYFMNHHGYHQRPYYRPPVIIPYGYPNPYIQYYTPYGPRLLYGGNRFIIRVW